MLKLSILMAFKIVEGFFAFIALIKGFAGSRAKLTEQCGVMRMTAGTFNILFFGEK